MGNEKKMRAIPHYQSPLVDDILEFYDVIK